MVAAQACWQGPLDFVSDSLAEGPGLVGGVLVLGDNPVDDAGVTQDDVGGQAGQCAAAGSFDEDDRHGGRRQLHELGQAPGDLAGEAAFLGRWGQFGAWGVDDRDERQAEFAGEARDRDAEG
jgi:hypothetical protein